MCYIYKYSLLLVSLVGMFVEKHITGNQ